MFQPDLFGTSPRKRQLSVQPERPMNVAAILDRLTSVCERPRYSFMVLNLIVEAGGETGRAGPYIRDGNKRVPVRDWLCEAMKPVARRDPRRIAIAQRVRKELEAENALPENEDEAAGLIEAQVDKRIQRSGKTNVSRAVTELVRAGLVRRHYQGYRVDHQNRGAKRQAVYTVVEEARRALRAR